MRSNSPFALAALLLAGCRASPAAPSSRIQPGVSSESEASRHPTTDDLLRAENAKPTRIRYYDVRDLDLDPLSVGSLSTSVRPDLWVAEPRPVAELRNGVIVLRGPVALHDAVEDWLDERRRAMAPASHGSVR